MCYTFTDFLWLGCDAPDTNSVRQARRFPLQGVTYHPWPTAFVLVQDYQQRGAEEGKHCCKQRARSCFNMGAIHIGECKCSPEDCAS